MDELNTTNTEGILKYIEMIKGLETPDNVIYFIISVILIIILSVVRELIINKKENTKMHSSIIMTKIALSVSIGYIALLILNKPVLMLFAIFITIPISELLFNKYLSFFYDDKLNDSTDSYISNGQYIPEEEDPPPIEVSNEYEVPIEEEIPIEETMEPSSTHIKNDVELNLDPENLIDLAYMHDYISLNQRTRILEESFLVDREINLDRFLSMSVLTLEDIEILKAMRQLTKVRGKSATKEEALQWLISIKAKQRHTELINNRAPKKRPPQRK